LQDQPLNRQAGENLRQIKAEKPLVHNITNFVVMNWTANVLVAMGGSPVMAHAQEEVEEMTGIARALILNIGTLTPYWIDAMLMAGRAANARKVPVILDPVGSGATRLRTGSARRIIEEVTIDVVRGNASEVLSLAKAGSRTKGVDSLHSVDEAAGTAEELARELGVTLAITGAVDLVTDGKRTLRVANGHPMLGTITGTGCAATVVIGAFLAVERDALAAAAGGLALFGLAGELAAERADGPGSFQTSLLDELYAITPARLHVGAKIESGPIASG